MPHHPSHFTLFLQLQCSQQCLLVLLKIVGGQCREASVAKCFDCCLVVDFFQHHCHHQPLFVLFFICMLVLQWLFYCFCYFWYFHGTDSRQLRLAAAAFSSSTSFFYFCHHHHHPSCPLCFCKSMILVSLDWCPFLSLCSTQSRQHAKSRRSIALCTNNIQQQGRTTS